MGDKAHVLNPLPRSKELSIAAAPLDKAEGLDGFLALMRGQQAVAHELGRAFSYANASLVQAFPQDTRKSADKDEWKNAGHDRVVEYMEVFNLHEF